ncbi:hypothetical protein HMPREF3222_01629 [Clostridium perfringens]|uniref:Uncharacterized protein n=1 Tax=Clostridium perfringens TaxID=1502 RepID=A0A133N6A8_CLOPF|nr:hypothetical protein HMPREF3222_01629 [Clostridium perfringens]
MSGQINEVQQEMKYLKTRLCLGKRTNRCYKQNIWTYYTQ